MRVSYVFAVWVSEEVDFEVWRVSKNGDIGERGRSEAVEVGFWPVRADDCHLEGGGGGQIQEEESPEGPEGPSEWWVYDGER